MELADGTIVFCAATSKSGLRSESLTLLYLDEFAWLPTTELQSEFWTSNYPIMQAMDGGLVVSSTPNGKDLFYDLWRKTQKTIKGEDNPFHDTKWILEQINWKDVDPKGRGRDEAWKQQTIRDLAVGGKNGAERFAQEFDNSFEVQVGMARFFNQDVVARLHPLQPMFEWVPDKEYVGEPMKIYDQIADQSFLVGMDVSEGKWLNFSTVIGLSVRKQQLSSELDVTTYDIRQAFQWMHAGTLPDDVFNFLFIFLTSQLNDKWFLLFELNDVGRLFSTRFESLIAEISTGEFSKRNELFKDMLSNKFYGDNNEMISYLTRRTYRSLGSIKKRGYIPWGFKTDRRNNPDLKNNMKTVIDKGIVSVCDECLLEEMRLFEDRKGKEAVTHVGYQGVSHFDLVHALKFSTWMLSDRDRIKDVMSITPLMTSGMTRDQQVLEALLQANKISRNPRDAFRKQMEKESLEELDIEGTVPLKYDKVEIKDMGDVTSLWKRLGGFVRKR